MSKFNLVPELEVKAQEFLKQCTAQGCSVRIVQGFRSMEEQQKLYDQGRTTPGPIVTNAKPGKSKHNYGKAFDVCFIGSVPYPKDDKMWKTIADIGKAVGLTPGYYFKSIKDCPHFEIK